MTTKTKRVRGKLLDLSSNDSLAEVVVEISLTTPKKSTEKPSFMVSATTENYRPDLSDKSLKLELANQIVGEVFVTIEGITGDKTNYKIFLPIPLPTMDWQKAEKPGG
jgi:hypothetical protein